jgi:isoquinoline 1-oxidoreductase beta subunit
VIPVSFEAAAQQPPAPPARTPASFLKIGRDGSITVLLPTCEMGQGTHTGQAQILAEELGADWTKIIVTMPQQPHPDYRLPFGQMRSVGSFGIRFWHGPMRRAAAQAREMLTLAAAERLGVEPATLRAENGAIVHAASNRRLAFGDLVEAAMALPIPQNPTLLPDRQRMLTGRSVQRLDSPSKITGQAVFATDVKRPNRLHGAVRLAPVYSAEVASLDEASVHAMPGAVAVARVPKGAVVIAETWWQVKQAADALSITFTQTPADTLSTAEIDGRCAPRSTARMCRYRWRRAMWRRRSMRRARAWSRRIMPSRCSPLSAWSRSPARRKPPPAARNSGSARKGTTRCA